MSQHTIALVLRQYCKLGDGINLVRCEIKACCASESRELSGYTSLLECNFHGLELS